MSENYDIVPVDPSVRYIVTLKDGRALKRADGSLVWFCREADAQAEIDDMEVWNRRGQQPTPPPRPLPMDPPKGFR